MSRAAAAFDQTLAELGIGDEVDPVELGRRGALLAAADLVWARQLGTAFGTDKVRELLGSSRQAIHDRVQRGTLLAVPGADGRLQFPAFQFDRSGRPLPALGTILQTLRPAVRSPYTVASWFVTADPELEGKTPAEWLREGRDEGLAVQAATRYAARLRQ